MTSSPSPLFADPERYEEVGFCRGNGTDASGSGNARGGNVASYAVRKCRSDASVFGGEVSVSPKGWPLSLRADKGQAAVGYPAAAASDDSAESPGATRMSSFSLLKR